MLRIRNLSNKYQKRLIRPLYAHTQGYPYAGTLDPSLRNTDGSFKAPLSGDTEPGATRTANAYTLQGGLVPGTVVVLIGDTGGFAVAAGVQAETPFGLLANFVGGTLDDLGDENDVGVWRGPDSVYELLWPAFDDTSITTALSASEGGAVPLYAQPSGLLGVTRANTQPVVANLLEVSSSGKRIVIDLKV